MSGNLILQRYFIVIFLNISLYNKFSLSEKSGNVLIYFACLQKLDLQLKEYFKWSMLRVLQKHVLRQPMVLGGKERWARLEGRVRGRTLTCLYVIFVKSFSSLYLMQICKNIKIVTKYSRVMIIPKLMKLKFLRKWSR